MSYVRCSCSLFFHSLSFPPQWPLVVSAHFLTGAMFKLFFQQKNDSFPFFLSRQLSVALLLVKLRRLVAYFLFFSVFLFLNISIFVDMTINLSLILQTTRIQKQFPLSVFVFIDSLVVSASQDEGGYAISRQKNCELHLSCHTCRLSYFTLVFLWC